MLRTCIDGALFAALLVTIYVVLNFACLLSDRCAVASGLF